MRTEHLLIWSAALATSLAAQAQQQTIAYVPTEGVTVSGSLEVADGKAAIGGQDIAGLPPEDDGRRNFADLAEFIIRFETATNEDLISEFPDLISDSFDTFEVIGMYRRFAAEARVVLARYPRTAPFLS